MSIEAGRVEVFEPGDPPPPTSSLADAFFAKDGLLAEAIILRGYLGRSPVLPRADQYLASAREAIKQAGTPGARFDATRLLVRRGATDDEQRDAVARAIEAVRTAAAGHAAAQKVRSSAGDGEGALPEDPEERDALARVVGGAALDAWADAAEPGEVWDIDAINFLIELLRGITGLAEPHIPWRIYLTPNLDRYVDFHLTSLLAWRQEPRAERKDTYTVWLKGFSTDRTPSSYRVVQETLIGPSFSTYLGGDLVDDYLGQPGTQGTAWGSQGELYAGGKYGTTRRCAE